MTKKEFLGIIIGMTFGDGNLQWRDGYINPSLRINHSIKQKEYLLWKIDLIKPLFHYDITKGYFEKDVVNKKNGKTYKICGITTRVNSKLKTAYKLTYKPYKIFTRAALDKLTPLGIAIWYMDDGCMNVKNRTVMISTYTSLEENKIIQEYFKDKWDINWVIARHKDKYFLYKGYKSIDMVKFIDLVKSFIIPSMLYKIITIKVPVVDTIVDTTMI